MKKIKLNKIGSVLKNVCLPDEAEFVAEINSREGEGLVVEVLEEQEKYGKLELKDGSQVKIRKGDILAGVLGQRRALEGIVGVIPETVKPGDILQILNLGGLLGIAVSWNKDVVDLPIRVKVLGSLLSDGQPVNIHNFCIPPQFVFHNGIPIIAVIGTSMGSGKTTVATKIIEVLAKDKKLAVAAAKLTGVATQRDILRMKEAGAVEAMSFLDIGLTSTIDNQDLVAAAAKTVINTLHTYQPDAIVVELGDGIVGWYGVDKLLQDQDIVHSMKFVIACAHDLVGAGATAEIMKQAGSQVDFFSGPVTNTTAGTDYIEQFLHIPAADLRDDNGKFLQALGEKLQTRIMNYESGIMEKGELNI